MPADRRQTSGAKERLKQSFFLYLLGAPSLKALHVISQKQDQKEYSEIIKDLTERTNNVNVIAALVIASSAVYVAAGPPTDISTWDPQFPYFCMLASYGGGMLAIIAGFAQIIFLSIMGPGDINAADTSRRKFVALFTLLILPLFLLLIAALLAGVGWTGAVWLGDVLWIKVFMTTCYAAFLFIILVIIAVLY